MYIIFHKISINIHPVQWQVNLYCVIVPEPDRYLIEAAAICSPSWIGPR